jgi:hypothetical protein
VRKHAVSSRKQLADIAGQLKNVAQIIGAGDANAEACKAITAVQTALGELDSKVGDVEKAVSSADYYSLSAGDTSGMGTPSTAGDAATAAQATQPTAAGAAAAAATVGTEAVDKRKADDQGDHLRARDDGEGVIYYPGNGSTKSKEEEQVAMRQAAARALRAAAAAVSGVQASSDTDRGALLQAHTALMQEVGFPSTEAQMEAYGRWHGDLARQLECLYKEAEVERQREAAAAAASAAAAAAAAAQDDEDNKHL